MNTQPATVVEVSDEYGAFPSARNRSKFKKPPVYHSWPCLKCFAHEVRPSGFLAPSTAASAG